MFVTIENQETGTFYHLEAIELYQDKEASKDLNSFYGIGNIGVTTRASFYLFEIDWREDVDD